MKEIVEKGECVKYQLLQQQVSISSSDILNVFMQLKSVMYSLML